VLQHQTQIVLLLLLQDLQHLKNSYWLEDKPKKKTQEIQEEEELDEDQDKQKNEECALKDVKPEN
jgi:hypothetical protein